MDSLLNLYKYYTNKPDAMMYYRYSTVILPVEIPRISFDSLADSLVNALDVETTFMAVSYRFQSPFKTQAETCIAGSLFILPLNFFQFLGYNKIFHVHMRRWPTMLASQAIGIAAFNYMFEYIYLFKVMFRCIREYHSKPEYK